MTVTQRDKPGPFLVNCHRLILMVLLIGSSFVQWMVPTDIHEVIYKGNLLYILLCNANLWERV